MASSNRHPHTPSSQISFHDAHSNSYERMAGHCTEHIARYILSAIDSSPSPISSQSQPTLTAHIPALQPITDSSHILDLACGPGIVTFLLESRFPSSTHPNLRITATDNAPGMISAVQQKAQERGYANVQTQVADIRDLDVFANGTFSHVIVNFGVGATGGSDDGGSAKAAREVYRVLQTGGVAAVSSWAERSWPPAFEAAGRILRPNETLKNPMASPPGWERGSWLMRLLEDVGFGHNVRVVPVQTWTEAGSLEELTENMMVAVPMYIKDLTEEEKGKMAGLLKEGLRNLDAFEEDERGARIGMLAWVGIAWK